MLGLHFTPACVLLTVCSLHFTLSLHFTPGPQSAVRSPQSVSYPDRIFFGFATFQIRYVRVRQLQTGLAAFWRSSKLASLEEKA